MILQKKKAKTKKEIGINKIHRDQKTNYFLQDKPQTI